MFNLKKISILTLLFVFGAGFCFLDNFSISIGSLSPVEAARKAKKTGNKSKKTEKKSETNKNTETLSDDSSFLIDNEKAKDYMPDIFRCPDCGYEQDEEGYCPDHSSLKLVKIISNPNDPLAPQELDGNEDILVDVPLNIEFKKDELEEKVKEEKATADKKSTSENSSNKTSKQSKKRK